MTIPLNPRATNNGKGHREALTVTDIELGVWAARGRRRRQHREARDVEIMRLAGEGRSQQAIADALGIPYHTVRGS